MSAAVINTLLRVGLRGQSLWFDPRPTPVRVDAYRRWVAESSPSTSVRVGRALPKRASAIRRRPPHPRTGVLGLVKASKQYRGRGAPAHWALRDITLRIPRGKVVGILGHSGSGKTTILNLLAHLDRPSWGRSYLSGNPTAHLSPKARAKLRAERIGLVFQEPRLIRTWTVRDNVAAALMFVGEDPWRIECRVRHTLLSLGLSLDLLDARPAELSGGMQQRVAIARSLVRDPEVLVADEPTSSLDPANERNVFEILHRLTRADVPRSVVVVTHRPSLAYTYADEIHLLSGGSLIASAVRRDGEFDAGFIDQVAASYDGKLFEES